MKTSHRINVFTMQGSEKRLNLFNIALAYQILIRKEQIYYYLLSYLLLITCTCNIIYSAISFYHDNYNFYSIVRYLRYESLSLTYFSFVYLSVLHLNTSILLLCVRFNTVQNIPHFSSNKHDLNILLSDVFNQALSNRK